MIWQRVSSPLSSFAPSPFTRNGRGQKNAQPVCYRISRRTVTYKSTSTLPPFRIEGRDATDAKIVDLSTSTVGFLFRALR